MEGKEFSKVAWWLVAGSFMRGEQQLEAAVKFNMVVGPGQGFGEANLADRTQGPGCQTV